MVTFFSFMYIKITVIEFGCYIIVSISFLPHLFLLPFLFFKFKIIIMEWLNFKSCQQVAKCNTTCSMKKNKF